MLAMSLLTEYVQLFWTTAWPQNPLHKRRFAQQILKRFDSASSSFSQRADEAQRENVQGLLAHLAQVWHSREPGLAKEVDDYAAAMRGHRSGLSRQWLLMNRSSNTLAAAMATPREPKPRHR